MLRRVVSGRARVIGVRYSSSAAYTSSPSEPREVMSPLDTFPRRHIGPRSRELMSMLETVGFK